MGSVPNILVVHPSLGVANVQELIALAKSKPDQIRYATSGVGTLSHLSGELLNFLAGIKLVHVPYQGSAQAMADVLAGRVMAAFRAGEHRLAARRERQPQGARDDGEQAQRDGARRADHGGGFGPAAL